MTKIQQLIRDAKTVDCSPEISKTKKKIIYIKAKFVAMILCIIYHFKN